MKYTLLEITRRILSSMSSDEVNSISDTGESQQIALICQTVFYDIASELNLPEHFSVFELQASGDPDKPTIMYRPDTAHSVEWIKYNIRTSTDTNDIWRQLTYLPINTFFDYLHNLPTDTGDNIISYNHTVNGDSITLYARNDIAPQFYSTYDDNTVLFDAYDASVDTTLQKTKTLSFGGKSETFILTDSFVPPFDEQTFALYYNECKSLAWAELKEVTHQSAERSAKRHRTALQQNKAAFGDKMSAYDRLPHYGRNGHFITLPKVLRNGN